MAIHATAHLVSPALGVSSTSGPVNRLLAGIMVRAMRRPIAPLVAPVLWLGEECTARRALTRVLMSAVRTAVSADRRC